MAFSSGAQRDLYYAEESAFGAAVETESLAMTEIRNTDDSISLARDSFVSDERRGDRGIHDMRLGNKQPAGDISFEFSYGAFDDFMAAALGADYDKETETIADAWVVPYNLTGESAVTVTLVASTNTITRTDEGSWITDGVKVGDTLVVTGLAEPNDAINEKVTAVTATDIVLGEAEGLADVSVAESGSFTTTAEEIKKGSTVTSFAIEKAFTDIEEYQLYTGCIVNTMSLDISPNSMITGSLGILGKDAVNGDTAYDDGEPASVPTNRPFDAFTGYIEEGGSTLATASSLSISLDNGFNRNFVLMQNTCPQMTSGKSNATGSVTLYFADSLIYNKFVNETESSIELQLADNMDNSYVISLPRIKYSSADTPVGSDDAIINTMNYQALDDATQATNIAIRRQPAVVSA